jgi:hypothetical protein
MLEMIVPENIPFGKTTFEMFVKGNTAHFASTHEIVDEPSTTCPDQCTPIPLNNKPIRNSPLYEHHVNYLGSFEVKDVLLIAPLRNKTVLSIRIRK